MAIPPSPAPQPDKGEGVRPRQIETEDYRGLFEYSWQFQLKLRMTKHPEITDCGEASVSTAVTTLYMEDVY